MKTFTILKFALVSCCLSIATLSFALSDPETHWNSGKVQLQNGEWLSGELHFNADLGLLEFNLDGVTTVLSAHKVASFYFFDYQANRMRNFVVESFKHNDHFVPTFFELLVDGRIRLLGREQVIRVPFQEEKQKRNVYYFQQPNGEIVKYKGRLKQIYRTLNDRREDVAFFVNRVKWYNFDEKPVVELFRYCNSL
ncbi:hypothetical protein [Siphonobacter sp. SORGH_AS_1065]|uniref:hypothetical protein n=1 Tax=Siphonobacter sp. SORGH_AS_1065 TaxID=3041795 RepID=UPI0027821BBC|nr:hypothetical protein [Siphonobacter sp. SORGH_AS_1065]MDQ1088203.1 hypothetical protein [Siphonobacter sp. SORGH_AS_1065]